MTTRRTILKAIAAVLAAPASLLGGKGVKAAAATTPVTPPPADDLEMQAARWAAHRNIRPAVALVMNDATLTPEQRDAGVRRLDEQAERRAVAWARRLRATDASQHYEMALRYGDSLTSPLLAQLSFTRGLIDGAHRCVIVNVPEGSMNAEHVFFEGSTEAAIHRPWRFIKPADGIVTYNEIRASLA